MAYFPLFIDLKDKKCVVVGGGMVAYRKVMALLEFEAKVTVIAPEFCESICLLKDIVKEVKTYETTDIAKACIVIAATNNAVLNRKIAEDCNERNIPVNVVDMQKECSFIFPAFVKRGAITVGVTSSGKSPVISQRIKKDVEEILPDYIEELGELLGEVRNEVKALFATEAERKAVFSQIVEAGFRVKGRLTKEEVKEIIDRAREREEGV